MDGDKSWGSFESERPVAGPRCPTPTKTRQDRVARAPSGSYTCSGARSYRARPPVHSLEYVRLSTDRPLELPPDVARASERASRDSVGSIEVGHDPFAALSGWRA